MLTLRDKSYVVTLTVYSSCVIFGMVCGAKLIPVWFAGLFGIALIFAVLSLVRWSQPALEELQAKYDSLKFQWDSLQDHEHARFVAETEQTLADERTCGPSQPETEGEPGWQPVTFSSPSAQATSSYGIGSKRNLKRK